MDVPGVRLRDWAEERVPQLAEDARSGLTAPGLTGEILFEDGESAGAADRRTVVPSTPAPASVALRFVGALLVALVVLAVVLGLLAALLSGVMVGRHL